MKVDFSITSRGRHYLSLGFLLILMTIGGVVTLNCTPSESIPQGMLEEGQSESVRRTSGGGIAFDTTDANVNSARFILPSKITVNGAQLDVSWESPSPIEALVAGDVIATVFKDETRRSRTVTFIGRYVDRVGVVRETSYPLHVSNF